MGWESLEIEGKPCRVYKPRQPHPLGWTVVALHDRPQNGQAGAELEAPVLTQSFETHGLLVIAPTTGLSWWADKVVPAFDQELTPEQFVCKIVLPWIGQTFGKGTEHADSSAPSPPRRLALFGIGMGGQGALRIAYKHPNDFPVVAAIQPDLDYQRHILTGDTVLYELYGDVERARQDTALLHIHPLNWPRHQFFCCDPDDWPIFESVDRLRMKLGSIGVPFECDTNKPRAFLGIRKPYLKHAASIAFQFMMERLEKERLRMV